MDGYRPWDGLLPDALGLIFRKLPLQKILSVVPRVCKSWENVVRGPYCWHEIDIEEWSRFRDPEDVDRMLRMLISRSGNSLRKLRVYGLSNADTLSLIADNAKSLQDLQLPQSNISDSILEQVAPRLSNVTSLDLSYCTGIGPVALQAVGIHCKSLTTLLRSMHPWDILDRRSEDSEAQAIAATMPNLRRLELAYMRVSTESVVRLITGLKGLELLDVRGCWDVKLDQDLLNKVPKLQVVGPLVPNSYATDSASDEYYGEGYQFDDLWGGGEYDNITGGGEYEVEDNLWGGGEYDDITGGGEVEDNSGIVLFDYFYLDDDDDIF